MEQITPRQRLLALDAAATLCESGFAQSNPDIHAAVTLLNEELDKHFNKVEKPESFEEFMREQQEACKVMANEPILFGI